VKLSLLLGSALLAAVPPPAAAAPPGAVPVAAFELANGMRFLLVERPERTTVAAGWVAHVGSADETAGKTGLTHLLEHLLFQGSETVGTRDWAAERRELAAEEELAAEVRAAYRRQRQRFRAGEIADPFDPAARPPELVELERRLAAGAARRRALVIPGELARLYAEAGAQGLNALTLQDMTLFFVTVPAARLELWFWLESDRLAHPAFRDFYGERSVVREERRQRTESTPTGPFDQELRALFWQSHPYRWPVVGWPSDLEALSRADAARHLATYYGPGNLTAVLVGRFDPARVRELAERYFGRLPPAAQPVPEVVTLEEPQRAERRLLVRCDCRPQVQVLYHTVPFVHPDSAPLEVLTGLLDGRTGRLYRSLVLGQGIAASAYAAQSAMRWAGMFSFTAEPKGEATPEIALAAWEEQLARLRAEAVGEEELTKVKNQIAADAYRRLRDPAEVMMRLLMDDGFGDWRRAVDGGQGALAVTAADVARVVRRYFAPENRTVGLYSRREGSGGPG
jgi:predicted Zn-dependent peptidase